MQQNIQQNKTLSITSTVNSFKNALNGLSLLLKEPNIKIHFFVTLVVIVAGFIKHLNTWQWIVIIFTIALVIITEALNTCIEKLCDFTCDNKWYEAIKTIKDISAAAVLIASIISVIVGVIIFLH